MRITDQRRAVITALRIRGGKAPVSWVMSVTGYNRRVVRGVARRMMKHEAVTFDREDGDLMLLPMGYVAVGSFPPKAEKETRDEDEGVRAKTE